MSLKIKALQGFSWTVFEGIFSQGIIFSVGIILARLLSPKDFGLIGIITAFIAISNSIIEGGLGSALVRKTDSSQDDYNTVFYSNLGIALLLYLLIYLFSGAIADFFDAQELKKLLQFSGLILIINAFSIIQQTLLVKILDFKTQGIIAVISSAISGFVAVVIAYSGFGVWSLVALAVTRTFIRTSLLWFKGRWKPTLGFSEKSYKELFNFGYKLLAASLLNTLYKNVYYVLIGKYFSPTSLGYYTRADQFQAPFSSNITVGITRISFPVLSSLQDEEIRLRHVFIKFIRFSVFVNFTILLALAAMAKPIVLLLIGEKWYPSIYFLQLLCIPGMLYPLQILNLNLLAVKGYSNLYLKLEIIKKVILLPLVFVSMLFSIEVVLYCLILFSIMEYFINSYYTKGLINLSVWQQIQEILPFLLISALNFMAMYSITFIEGLTLTELFLLQLIIGIIALLILHEFFKLNEYKEFKERVFQYLKRRGNLS